MKKLLGILGIILLVAIAAGTAGLLRQQRQMRNCLIRLHVEAASDDVRDQSLKLEVRDAVMEVLAETMENVTDVHQAEQYLRGQLPNIQQVAQDTLNAGGCGDSVKVSLGEAYFDTRHYDTFSLPAGFYHALRITIGQGTGKNWWCVVYPNFCMPGIEEDFAQQAVAAGFSDSLTGALKGEQRYEIRFFLLDLLGKLNGFLRKG